MTQELDARYGMVMNEKEQKLYQSLKPSFRHLDDLVHDYIQDAFTRTGFNRKVTAQLLGISRWTLARRLQQKRRTKLK